VAKTSNGNRINDRRKRKKLRICIAPKKKCLMPQASRSSHSVLGLSLAKPQTARIVSPFLISLPPATNQTTRLPAPRPHPRILRPGRPKLSTRISPSSRERQCLFSLPRNFLAPFSQSWRRFGTFHWFPCRIFRRSQA